MKTFILIMAGMGIGSTIFIILNFILSLFGR